MAIESEKEAQKILSDLNNAEYIVSGLDKKETKKYPAPPFTTSTLQQESASKLNYSAKQTMRLAQDLYEDGLITYMRTDSVSVSTLATKEAKEVISEIYGENYALEVPKIL